MRPGSACEEFEDIGGRDNLRMRKQTSALSTVDPLEVVNIWYSFGSAYGFWITVKFVHHCVEHFLSFLKLTLAYVY